VTDDPLLPRAVGSRPFDGEGIASKIRPLFRNGVLESFYVDTYYARKLGVSPTAADPSNLAWSLGAKDRAELLRDMPPFLGGGHMISRVGDFESTWAEGPQKFEAGTMPVAEAIGLGAALDWLSGIGMDAVREHGRDVTTYAMDRLSEVPGLTLYGTRDSEQRGSLATFVLDGIHPHDVAEILGRGGVCVRAGHHCAQPLMRRFGTPASTRASFAIHNTREDVDRLIDGLGTVQGVFA